MSNLVRGILKYTYVLLFVVWAFTGKYMLPDLPSKWSLTIFSLYWILGCIISYSLRILFSLMEHFSRWIRHIMMSLKHHFVYCVRLSSQAY